MAGDSQNVWRIPAADDTPSARPCAVVPAKDNAASIGNVIRQLRRAGIPSCVVVANGCSDDTPAQALRHAKEAGVACFALEFASALGPDVPRAAGAFAALRVFPGSDPLVLVDGDWLGSFGPSLESAVCHALAARWDVQFVTSATAVSPLSKPSTGHQSGLTCSCGNPALAPFTPGSPVPTRLCCRWWCAPGYSRSYRRQNSLTPGVGSLSARGHSDTACASACTTAGSRRWLEIPWGTGNIKKSLWKPCGEMLWKVCACISECQDPAANEDGPTMDGTRFAGLTCSTPGAPAQGLWLKAWRWAAGCSWAPAPATPSCNGQRPSKPQTRPA